MIRAIRHALNAFVNDESGLVQPKKSMPLAWVVGTLAVATIMFGTPGTAEAAYCWASDQSCSTDLQCTAVICPEHQWSGGECLQYGSAGLRCRCTC